MGTYLHAIVETPWGHGDAQCWHHRARFEFDKAYDAQFALDDVAPSVRVHHKKFGGHLTRHFGDGLPVSRWVSEEMDIDLAVNWHLSFVHDVPDVPESGELWKAFRAYCQLVPAEWRVVFFTT